VVYSDVCENFEAQSLGSNIYVGFFVDEFTP